VHLEKANFKSYNHPEFIIHNYKEYADYVNDLKEVSKNFTFTVYAIEEYRLPHYRYFEFISTDLSFTIRVDGGIAHGFKPVERLLSNEMNFDNQVFDIRKDVNYDIIFNINYE
jgi:hypothetical protein